MSLRTVAPQPKYGLIKKRPAAAPLKKTGFSEAFNDGSDDDTGPTANYRDVNRVNSLLTQKSAAAERQANKIYTDALDQDPSAFDYDDAYDSFKAPEVTAHALSQANTKDDAPKARYISNLMTTASVRTKEKDRIYEKKLLKERKLEDEQYGDKPKFMTTAYKAKLIEDQKWEHEDRMTDELEARTDVRSQGMHGFYSNLLTKNVAMGGDVEGSALSAYTAGSQRQSQMSSAAEVAVAVAESVVEEDGDDARSKRKYDDNTSSSSNSSSNKAIRSTEDEQEDQPQLQLEVRPSSDAGTVESRGESAPIVPSKAEVISSARQRFLDRKAASG